MKVSCSQEDLSKGLAVVGRAVATRAVLPITNNILVATEGSQLKLAATNLEIAITCWIGATIEEEGTITIPARLVTDFVNSLPSGRIDMILSPRSQSLELRCARDEAHVSGLDPADFPPIPKIDEGVTIKVKPEELRMAINQVAFAAASEESRPVLTGVDAEFDGDQLTLAAADGFRLAVRKLSLDTPVDEKLSVIIPARSLAELNRLITDQQEPVELTINPKKSQVIFRLRNVEMVSQLIQGTFPNYEQLIPQAYSTRAVVKLSEFLRATRSASIFARDGSGIVRLQIMPKDGKGKIAISARAEEIGDNLGEVDAVVEGEETKIAFNSRYLMDVLGVLTEEEVALEATTSSSPGVIRPVGKDNYIHVVMPMFVQW
ncbi:MAG: DNA polymerase III subunit beta [Dehalococcoidia bacterium]|nr:MAG: DNA polymerase III subunit beta [Dehalococcoidia bacterium]